MFYSAAYKKWESWVSGKQQSAIFRIFGDPYLLNDVAKPQYAIERKPPFRSCRRYARPLRSFEMYESVRLVSQNIDRMGMSYEK
jgi:hypothetical protein